MDNPALLRKKIDLEVDRRKRYQPTNMSDIVVVMKPRDLHKACGMPPPPHGQPYPDHIIWRGYRIVSRPPKKPPKRAMGATWF